MKQGAWKTVAKFTGATILFSTSLHITVIFYHLAFGADKVVINEPNTLLVKSELVLAFTGLLYCSYLLLKEGNNLLNSVHER